MTITLEEAVERARATGGRIVYEGPAGERAEVDVPPPPDNEDYGPAYLDPPFPAPPVSGVRIPPENIRLANPFPMKPIVIDEGDLAPE